MNKLFSISLFIIIFLSACASTSAPKEKTMKFGMQAVLTAVEGKGDDLAEIMSRASAAVSEIEGCELYLVQQSLTDENQILITELWQSSDHHKASLKNEEVIKLISEARPIIANMEGKPAKFIGGHGVSY